MRRSDRRIAGLLALGLLAALATTAAWPSPARAAVVPPTGKAADIAKEVCEDMVTDAVESASERTLVGPPQGVWTASDHFTCTYDVGGGTITLGVRVLKSKRGASSAFDKAKRSAKKTTRLNGLGQGAFQAGDGTLVARKDQFLLTIDPLTLPAGVKKADVALAASVAVLACWTGGT